MIEYKDPAAARRLVERISAKVSQPLRFMEVCGTHTVAISRSGIRSLLNGVVDLVSGPGCPVCVTADAEIDRMLAYCDVPGAIVATYGDLVRVPGSRSSLAERRAAGADVRVVYSALDAVDLARVNPGRPVIFLGIGFETTAPAAALAIATAADAGLGNFFVHSAHKLTPPALRALLGAGRAQLDGFLCPGHVSTVLGEDGFAFLPVDFGLPAAIGGFEPVDMLLAVDYLVDAALGLAPVRLQNAYPRWVKPEGNPRARSVLDRAFEPCAARWRGLGSIEASGLALRAELAAHNAEVAFPAKVAEPAPRTGCRCGEVLRGEIKPPECRLFGTACLPAHPLGPCMVSGEGACAAYHKYGEGVP